MLDPDSTQNPDTEELDAQELDALVKTLFASWQNASGILAAVSGGPDSMALLHMLSRWQIEKSSSTAVPPISAATVDHGLRAEAQEEAEIVKAYAGKSAIEHTTLVWQHDGTTTRIQERARNARYQLLCAHARRIGADTIMTAHHAGDQAETILFRLTRGSGLRGLAGMKPHRAMEDLMLARPLLSQHKSALVDYCRRNKVPFIDDPSNHDARFARPRMRNILPVLEQEGMGPQEWQRLANRMRRADDALAQAATAASSRLANGNPQSGWTLDFAQLASEPEEIALRVLIDLVESFATTKTVRLDRAETLLHQLLQARASGNAHKATLGATTIRLNSKGILTLKRQSERRRGQTRQTDA